MITIIGDNCIPFFIAMESRLHRKSPGGSLIRDLMRPDLPPLPSSFENNEAESGAKRNSSEKASTLQAVTEYEDPYLRPRSESLNIA